MSSAPILWRESLHRRLLGIADALCAGLALALVLSLFDQRQVTLAAAGGVALIVLLFKVAGLYDRDDLRLVHSTLDEVPLLTQVTGLFALAIAAIQTTLLPGDMQPPDHRVVDSVISGDPRPAPPSPGGRRTHSAPRTVPGHRRAPAGQQDSRKAELQPSSSSRSGLNATSRRRRRR